MRHPEYDERVALNRNDISWGTVVLATVLGFCIGFFACHSLYTGLESKPTIGLPTV